MPERNPSFLKTKYQELGASEEVAKIAERTKVKTGEKVPEKPDARIQNYLDYLHESLEPKNPRREEKLTRFKQALYDKYVIKSEEIPESYFDTQRRLAREQGHGDIEISDELRRQTAEIIITDQKSSLNNWVDYLSSPDATYPDWLKYWAVRSILGMGEYDKEKKAFTKRDKGTVKPFPDIDREALAYVFDEVKKKYAGQRTRVYGPLLEDEQKWEDLLKGENFAKLYAWAIEKVTPASQEQLVSAKGEWVKYSKGSDHLPLVQSLQGHGTGWCTAGESTAEIQLKGGDFYVFYSLDQQGKPIVPRAAIRMQENNIAEIRGIGPDQNLDPHINQVVQDKLKEFPDGKLYEKKNQDMKQLTALENKIKKGQELTCADLVFLYEINSPIQGFGYQKDPRLQEIREKRDPKADASVVFDCPSEQIAWGQKEITKNTKAYIGPLFSNVFQSLKYLEHIYTTFPEGHIKRSTIEIGGKTEVELERELEEQKINVSDYARGMMRSKDFTTAKNPEMTHLVRLKVRDLNLQNPTTENIYKKAEELGLELCPPEVGPRFRLQYFDQPLNEYVFIGMKQITDPDGRPIVFWLRRFGEGLWLSNYWAGPTSLWSPGDEFIFRLRK
ncbi:MAG: hypothetical protein Q8M83_00840 [bacterium]|nr:hypothetical protein [bacterium]